LVDRELKKPSLLTQDWRMSAKMTKNEILTELDLRIGSSSPDMPATSSTTITSENADDIAARDAQLSLWRDQVQHAADGDPILDEIAAHLAE
jgi:hypothetical protein